MRKLYYTETYTETRIRCFIGIISRILTDLYRINKREYGLHVFMESLCDDIRESYSKNTQERFVLYSPYSVRIRENTVLYVFEIIIH